MSVEIEENISKYKNSVNIINIPKNYKIKLKDFFKNNY